MPEEEKTAPEKLNLDVDHWNAKKDKLLLKHGFPRHSLIHTKVLAVFEFENKTAGEPDLCLIYNESGKLEDALGYEPFKSEEEFEEVCRKTAGYFKEAYESRLSRLTEAIKTYQNKAREQVGRTWTHKPQEQEETYDFSGKGLLTKGITKGLTSDEINLIFASIQKRVVEKKLEFRDKVAVAIDYLQVFQADDGTKVFAIDQLNHEMKTSGDFVPDADHWTMMLDHEY